MLQVAHQIQNGPVRPATAAAVFSFPRGAMARRGRSRKNASRTPGGQLSRAGHSQADTANFHLSAHRIESIDREAATKARSILAGPEAARSREEQDVLLAIASRARNVNLGYQVGIAFERGLFRWVEDKGQIRLAHEADFQAKTEIHDGRELSQAADIFAGLHHQVWGKLPKDIEAEITRRYGLDVFNLLGRVDAPAPPCSHFRQLVASGGAPSDDSDFDEYVSRRLKLADRYREASQVLINMGLLAYYAVDNIVVKGTMPNFLKPGFVRTAQSGRDQRVFCEALMALAQHFRIFDRRVKDRAAA